MNRHAALNYEDFIYIGEDCISFQLGDDQQAAQFLNDCFQQIGERQTSVLDLCLRYAFHRALL